METKLSVTLIEHTPEPEKLVAAAAKLCYSHAGAAEIMEDLTPENVDKFLNRLMDMGHASPIEHASFTFAIEGVSRALTHQLVRHRMASFSQKSQRYVTEGQFNYIVPYEIANIPEAKEEYIRAMENAQHSYVVTMNVRELLHFFNQRCCMRAQWEIRACAIAMLVECRKVAPILFKNAGPRCVEGPCPEGVMSCGKINEVRETFKAL